MWRGNREDAVARRMNSRDLGSMEWKNPGKPRGRLNLQDAVCETEKQFLEESLAEESQ